MNFSQIQLNCVKISENFSPKNVGSTEMAEILAEIEIENPGWFFFGTEEVCRHLIIK